MAGEAALAVLRRRVLGCPLPRRAGQAVKVRTEGRVETRPLITALGLSLSGEKEVLGLWLTQTESAPAYAQILSELQARGVEDIVVAATDGLAGAADAVMAVFPKAAHQHCLVHQMRSSLALIAQKDRKAVAGVLKAVYRAPTQADAETRLADAEAEWGARYGAVFASWHRHWPSLVAFYDLPVGLRRVLYTTNAVEAVHRSFRRALKHRGALPNEMAALKLCYAMAERLAKKWTRALPSWPLLRTNCSCVTPNASYPSWPVHKLSDTPFSGASCCHVRTVDLSRLAGRVQGNL